MNQVAKISEQRLISCLLRAVSHTGLQTNPVDIINLYVSLKSKSLAIVTGPAGQGKALSTEAVVHTLAGNNPLRLQVISGHPQWATNTGNVAFFGEAQSRLMTAKIQALVDEARLPSNREHLFIVCLTGITPAEFYSVFVATADQGQHDIGKHRVVSSVFQTVPIPANLLMVGTMDTNDFNWLIANHYSEIGFIDWPEGEKPPPMDVETIQHMPDIGDRFLQARITDTEIARHKLDSILGNSHHTLCALQRVRDTCRRFTIQLPHCIDDELIVYLANAWSTERIGLFSASNLENLLMATDLAIAQMILPKLRSSIVRSGALHKQLQEVMMNYPRSSAFLKRLRKQPVRNRLSSKDTNFTDPVCGMVLKPGYGILRTQYQGQVYYFCSHNCKFVFDGAPEKFADDNVEVQGG